MALMPETLWCKITRAIPTRTTRSGCSQCGSNGRVMQVGRSLAGSATILSLPLLGLSILGLSTLGPAAAYSSWMNAAKSANPGAFTGSFTNPWTYPNANPWASPWANSWTNPWANAWKNPWGNSSPWQMPGFMFGDWNNQWTELCNKFSDLAGKVSEAGANNASSVAEWMPSFDEMFSQLRQSFDSMNSDNAKRIADTVKMFGGTASGSFPFASPEGVFSGIPKVGADADAAKGL